MTISSADNPTVHTEIALDLFEEYKLHASVDTGGRVEYNGKTLVTSEKGGQTEVDVYLRKGTEYTLKAVPLEGYEFTGWKNEKGELVQKEAQISGKLTEDTSCMRISGTTWRRREPFISGSLITRSGWKYWQNWRKNQKTSAHTPAEASR